MSVTTCSEHQHWCGTPSGGFEKPGSECCSDPGHFSGQAAPDRGVGAMQSTALGDLLKSLSIHSRVGRSVSILATG